MPKPITALLMILLCSLSADAQSYYRTMTVPLAQAGIVYDTISVQNLNQAALNTSFGLDSVTVNLNCPWAANIVISLIAPDGTMIHLSEQNGGYSGAHYTNTCFDMDAEFLISELSAPFTGHMRPDQGLNLLNNGQNGNGTWQLRILNKDSDWNAYLISWGLHFNNTPAQPQFSSSNLPIVVVNTNHASLSFNYWHSDHKDKVNGTMGIIYNGPGQTNFLNDSINHYSGNILIRYRGATSLSHAQRSYTIDTKDANWEDTDVSLLGMPAEEDLVLYAPWNDKSLIRNVLTYQLSTEMGNYAPRTRLCELIYDGDYRGVYVLMENIKRGSDRVSVNKLDSTDVSGSQLTGGYILQIDRAGLADSNCFEVEQLPCPGSPIATTVIYEYPRIENINQAQKQYIQRYVDSFAFALALVPHEDQVNGYRHFIDVPSFIDFSISQELSNNVDAYGLSTYMYKKRNGKLYAGPVWDFDRAYGNAYYAFSWAIDNFRWDAACPSNSDYPVPYWWKAMREDTTYLTEFNCRYSQLRSGPLRHGHIDALIDSLTDLLAQAQQRHFNRWPILGRHIDPQVFIGQTYQEEVDYMKDWLHNRIDYMDQQFSDISCPIQVTTTNKLPEDITIYPNPASEMLHIISSSEIKAIAIYNILGGEVYRHGSAHHKHAINLKPLALAAGSYILEVQTAKERIREKFFVTE